MCGQTVLNICPIGASSALTSSAGRKTGSLEIVLAVTETEEDHISQGLCHDNLVGQHVSGPSVPGNCEQQQATRLFLHKTREALQKNGLDKGTRRNASSAGLPFSRYARPISTHFLEVVVNASRKGQIRKKPLNAAILYECIHGGRVNFGCLQLAGNSHLCHFDSLLLIARSASASFLWQHSSRCQIC